MKTRHLSIATYFKYLQLEYIVAELRSKIYISNIDKQYWRGVMKGKKEKILDIALRNALPSIFTKEGQLHYNGKTKQEYYAMVYKEWGLPDFHYVGEEEKNKFFYRDEWNYYRKNEEVRVLGSDNEVSVGIIIEIDFKRKFVSVKIEEKIIVFNFKDVARTL